jgi:acyl-CoA synthetase (AMP-forming)/AMP-acid ligase II
MTTPHSILDSFADPANLGASISSIPDQNTVALIDLGGEVAPREYSYRLLHRLCQAVARGLLARGLAVGDRVGILSANRAEYLLVYLGAMQAGLVPVPINIKFPAATVHTILKDAGAHILFCDRPRASLCPDDIKKIFFGPSFSGTENPQETIFDSFLDSGSFQAIHPELGQPAMFLYTSGSTGVPKGVILTHASHLWVLAMRRRPADSPRIRTLVAAPLYHMNGLATSHAALAQHDSLVLLPGFEAASYIDAVERYRCDSLTAVPTMFSMILKRPEILARADFSHVRFLRMGSAPVSAGLLRSLREIFPKAQISNVYGTTEAGPIVFAPHPEGKPAPHLSLGYAHPQVSLRINGKLEGEATGMLEIKNPALMLGYHNQPENSRRAFTEDGYNRTGDIFHRDEEGFYFYVGRVDDMFSCGAENIYPGEVEKMLEGHPAIQQVAVVPVADEIKGAKPVAFVVLKSGVEATEREIQEYALAHAPAYHHPRRVWFLKELPLASTNKIDKQQLIQTATAAIKAKRNSA